MVNDTLQRSNFSTFRWQSAARFTYFNKPVIGGYSWLRRGASSNYSVEHVRQRLADSNNDLSGESVMIVPAVADPASQTRHKTRPASFAGPSDNFYRITPTSRCKPTNNEPDGTIISSGRPLLACCSGAGNTEPVRRAGRSVGRGFGCPWSVRPRVRRTDHF